MTDSRTPALLILCSLALVPVAEVMADDDLGQVLTRFDEVQNSIQSLSADFTMTTESTLLKDKIVAKGRVYLTKPDAVRWDFSSPEEMRFVISKNEYTGYFPAQKRAERRDIQRWREHLFRFLGLGQASSELSKFYEITIDEAGNDIPATILLMLDPKKQRVRKKMDAVRFWIEESTYMPVRVEYRSKKGDRRVIEFEKVALNPELAAGLYTVELPADVEVTKGFGVFSGFSPSAN